MGFRTNLVPIGALAANVTAWTNQPAIADEYLSATTNRSQVDLHGMRRVRLSVTKGVAGSAGSTVHAEYTLDLTGAAGWAALTTTATLVGTGVAHSTWQGITAVARKLVLVRLAGLGGNGVADPVITSATLELGF